MKRLGIYLSVALLVLSVSTPLAHSAVTPGDKCTKSGMKQTYKGTVYTCIKSGKKLVWNEGTKLKLTPKPIEPTKLIDYSTCIGEFVYIIWKLESADYSNVAQDFAEKYSARIDSINSNPRFGSDDLTFTNKTPCKVKVQITAELECYVPYGSQAYSYSISSRTGNIEVPASSKTLVNVGKFFPAEQYSCESTPPRINKASILGRQTGRPYLNFGTSVQAISIKVEGADAAAKPTANASPTPTTTSILGSIGPGGGIVFYDAGGQKPWGRYLEVAPDGWFGTPKDPITPYCNVFNAVGFTEPQNWTWFDEMGSGKSRTDSMLKVCSSGAAVLANAYKGGGKSDWYLPSRYQLNELCKYARNLKTSNKAYFPCSRDGYLRQGFEARFYWSSDESCCSSAYNQDFDTGRQFEFEQWLEHNVRPIRAF